MGSSNPRPFRIVYKSKYPVVRHIYHLHPPPFEPIYNQRLYSSLSTIWIQCKTDDCIHHVVLLAKYLASFHCSAACAATIPNTPSQFPTPSSTSAVPVATTMPHIRRPSPSGRSGQCVRGKDAPFDTGKSSRSAGHARRLRTSRTFTCAVERSIAG